MDNPFLAVLLSLTENRHSSTLENDMKKIDNVQTQKIGHTDS